MTYDEIKAALRAAGDDAVMRLEMVMDIGAHLLPVPDGAVCGDVSGCTSRVQICQDGVHFYASADSALVRGIVAIIIAIVDGKTRDEIKKMDIRAEFDALNLQLGAGRMNGVNSMISFLKNL